MARLDMIRAEMKEISLRLDNLKQDNEFHPWMKSDMEPKQEALRVRLRHLRRQEFILANAKLQPVAIDPAPHRRNATPDADEQVNTVVFLLLVIAVVGVSVAGVLHMVGALIK